MTVKKFSLLEAVIVIFILAIVFLPLYSLIQRGNTVIYQSENNIKAVNLCSEGLEWFSALPYASLLSAAEGEEINGMSIALSASSIKDSYFNLRNFSGYIPSSAGTAEFKYSAEFGGEGTASDKGEFHDFRRVGIIEKYDSAQNLTTNPDKADALKLTVIVKWKEGQSGERERVLSLMRFREGMY